MRLLPLFLLLDSKSPLDTLKASADEDSWCADVFTLLPSLFEHSLPTLSLTALEEAHSKLLLRLVAEEVGKDMEEEDVDVKDDDVAHDDEDEGSVEE